MGMIRGRDEVRSFLGRWYHLSDTTLSIEVTSRCNLVCSGCWVRQRGKRLARQTSSSMISPALMRHLLNLGFAIGIDKVQFVGGEPTLNKALSRYVQSAKDLGYRRIAMTSNGIVPWPVYREIIRSGLTDLSFSLDGSEAAGHDALRPTASGMSTFRLTVSNIRLAVREAKRCGLRVRVNHTIYPENLDDLEPMIRLSSSLDVHSIRIHYSLPGDSTTEKGSGSMPQAWIIEPKRWTEAVDRCRSLSRELSVRVFIPPVFGDQEVNKLRAKRPGYLQVRPDGTFIMCNTHDRLPNKEQRWFARLVGQKSLETNRKGIVFQRRLPCSCCQALPVLMEAWPIKVREIVARQGGMGCIYIPSPLLPGN